MRPLNHITRLMDGWTKRPKNNCGKREEPLPPSRNLPPAGTGDISLRQYFHPSQPCCKVYQCKEVLLFYVQAASTPFSPILLHGIIAESFMHAASLILLPPLASILCKYELLQLCSVLIFQCSIEVINVGCTSKAFNVLGAATGVQRTKSNNKRCSQRDLSIRSRQGAH